MNPRHSSESSEHYTPSDIVERARTTLGAIDLDPASCEEANRTVRAASYFTREDNGYRKLWQGRVFLNPPGGSSDNLERPVKPKCYKTGDCGIPAPHTHEGVQSSQKKWWHKLALEHIELRVPAAIFVCFSIELLQTTQVDARSLPIPLDFPICYPSRRVAYVNPGGSVGKQPPHASAIVCLGGETYTNRFEHAFASLGRVVVPQRRSA